MINELNIPQSEWQVGKSKVFLRSVVHEPLEDARKQVINAKATIIQTIWRRHHQQKQYKRLRAAVLRIQHAYTGWRLRIEFLRKRRACVVIQSHLRGVFAREVAAALREMRRVEEEMRKRERLEAERKEREKQISEQQAEEERKAIEECERYVPKNHTAAAQAPFNVFVTIQFKCSNERKPKIDDERFDLSPSSHENRFFLRCLVPSLDKFGYSIVKNGFIY